jgi:hypothetical protein
MVHRFPFVERSRNELPTAPFDSAQGAVPKE